jgi:hypothetical protein
MIHFSGQKFELGTSSQLFEKNYIFLIVNDGELPEKSKSTKRTDPAWQYYEIDGKNKKWRCKLCGPGL